MMTTDSSCVVCLAMPKSESYKAPSQPNERQKQVIRYLMRQKGGALVKELVENIDFYQGEELSTTKRQSNSTRMAQRDLHDLEALGYVKRSGRRTWLIGDKPFYEKLDRQAAIAIKTLEAFGDIPLDSENSRNIKGLFLAADSVLAQSSHFKRIKDKIAFKPWVAQRQRPVIQAEIYDVLVEAVLKEQKIRFAYTNAQGVRSDKRTSPLGVFFYRDMIYLVGYNGHVLTNYSLQRISYIEPVKNSALEFPADWQGLHYYITHTSLLPASNEEGRVQTVKIRFSNQYAVKNLKDAPFIHCEHSWETEDNGSFVITAQLLPNRELLTWVLYYGCHAEIVEPEFFRKMMAVEVQEMVKLYQQPSP
jgi:predicted DNA-binding transcriptional regulator YafY